MTDLSTYIDESDSGKYALKLTDALEQAGFEAWIVGGCVRDAILKKEPSDIDIATNATWEQVSQVAQNHGFKTYETGVKHGTVTVIPECDERYTFEVTTYRCEGAYSDSRHPDDVEFIKSIEEDLARRDFTVNAIAYHPSRGILDPYGGIQDIENRVIRAVGNPKKRFSEDGLRILRGCRFASQLGFSIESETFKAMLSCKSVLRKVSTERKTSELDKLLLGEHVHDAIMQTVDVLSFVIPELVAMKGFEQHTRYHKYDVLEHSAWVVQQTSPTRLTRWAALFHDMGKPASAFFDEDGVEHFYGHAFISVELARAVMKRMLMSPSFIDDVLTLVLRHDDVVEPEVKSVRRMLRRLDSREDLFCALCDIKRADALSQADECAYRADIADKLMDVLDEIKREDLAFSVKDLAINGNDLINAGMKSGPEIGEALESALNEVIEERVENAHKALMAYLKESEFLK